MNVTNLNFERFIHFLDWVSQKGMMKPSTVSSLKASSNKVLSVLDEEEKKDLSMIDLDDVFDRFKNLNAQQFSPASLRAYKSRTYNALNEFFKYQKAPENWKPSISQRSRQPKVNTNNRNDLKRSDNSKRDIQAPNVSESKASSLSHSFPLRSDLIIKIEGLPIDFKQSEAKRLSAFLLALCEDYQPGR